jgi:hypothetical protein
VFPAAAADLLTVQMLPEWPAANVMLRRFIKVLVEGEHGLKHKDAAVKLACVEFMGQLAAQLCLDALATEREADEVQAIKEGAQALAGEPAASMLTGALSGKHIWTIPAVCLRIRPGWLLLSSRCILHVLHVKAVLRFVKVVLHRLATTAGPPCVLVSPCCLQIQAVCRGQMTSCIGFQTCCCSTTWQQTLVAVTVTAVCWLQHAGLCAVACCMTLSTRHLELL